MTREQGQFEDRESDIRGKSMQHGYKETRWRLSGHFKKKNRKKKKVIDIALEDFEDAEVFFFYYQAFPVLRSWLKKNCLPAYFIIKERIFFYWRLHLGFLSRTAPKKPVGIARKEDVPYIKCQVCEILAKQLYQQVQSKKAEISPKKVVRLCFLFLGFF
ncbi:hypothetical protein MTR_6g077350 [Medicago truncatula]|uniref:Uncharacterized protein n=1 Tax=Medicago truncatula TaxID=3880 RepID=G7KK78_MEDTR|nr:hypothetical protein MTR_6g077350 [Medicago truncatula]